MNPSRNFKASKLSPGSTAFTANLAYAYHAVRFDLLHSDPRFQDLLGRTGPSGWAPYPICARQTGDCAPWTNLRSSPLASAHGVDAMSPVFSSARRLPRLPLSI